MFSLLWSGIKKNINVYIEELLRCFYLDPETIKIIFKLAFIMNLIVISLFHYIVFFQILSLLIIPTLNFTIYTALSFLYLIIGSVYVNMMRDSKRLQSKIKEHEEWLLDIQRGMSRVDDNLSDKDD